MGITFNREQCRLKHELRDSVKIYTNVGGIKDIVQSVRFSCAKDTFENVNENHEEMIIMMIIVTAPGIAIIIVTTVIIAWRRRRREMTPTEMREMQEEMMQAKRSSSVYENLTFVS